MIIVLIDWKILPTTEAEEAFLNKWKTELKIEDRSKMIGEFLSSPESKAECPWITWDMNDSAYYKRYINVGMWADKDAFYNVVGKYFKPEKEKESFEYELRTRTVLTPKCWRIGNLNIPTDGSEGVL